VTQLYTVSYNYCTSSRMNSGGVNETIGVAASSTRSQSPPPLPHLPTADWLNLTVVFGVHPGGANLMGADLYKHLQQYFISHLKQVREVRHLPPRVYARPQVSRNSHARPPPSLFFSKRPT
jgi:cullin 1